MTISNGYKRWAEPDERGVIRRTMLTPPQTKLDSPWIQLPMDVQAGVAACSGRYRYAGGKVELRRLARITISTNKIKADGNSVCEVMVIPAEPMEKREPEIEIEINGERTTVKPLQPLRLRSPVTGSFKISLIDPRFFATPAQWYVIAEEAQEGEEKNR
jgi:hypothetical protein